SRSLSSGTSSRTKECFRQICWPIFPWETESLASKRRGCCLTSRSRLESSPSPSPTLSFGRRNACTWRNKSRRKPGLLLQGTRKDLTFGRRPVRLEGDNLHRVGQGRIDQPVVPDRRFAGGVARLERANLARDAVALPALVELQYAL